MEKKRVFELGPPQLEKFPGIVIGQEARAFSGQVSESTGCTDSIRKKKKMGTRNPFHGLSCGNSQAFFFFFFFFSFWFIGLLGSTERRKGRE